MKLEDKFLECYDKMPVSTNKWDMCRQLAKISCSGDYCPVLAQWNNKLEADKDKITEILLRNSAIEEFALQDGSKVAYRVIGQAGFKTIVDEIINSLEEI